MQKSTPKGWIFYYETLIDLEPWRLPLEKEVYPFLYTDVEFNLI